MSEQCVRAARSLLFVPGTRPDRFAKALAAGADGVILDLEDAVEPEAKPQAREQVERWLGRDERPVLVRVNPPRSADGEHDLAMLGAIAHRSGLEGVVVAKTESPEDVALVHAATGSAVPLVPIIETARGLVAVQHIAAADGVARLVSGDLDLSLDLGANLSAGGGSVAAAVKMPIVVASRAASLGAPVDGADPDFTRLEKVRARVRHARELGFGGAICIHPAQVEAVHLGFAPDESDLERAVRILEALEALEGAEGAFQVDGQMVDKPVIEWARRTAAARPATSTER